MFPFDDLRDVLLEQRRVVFERVAHVGEDLHHFDVNVESERIEEGQEAAMARVLTRLDDRSRAQIEAIDRALVRIANGDYGRCDVCEKPISVGRLEALPTATTCTPCASALEHGKNPGV